MRSRAAATFAGHAQSAAALRLQPLPRRCARRGAASGGGTDGSGDGGGGTTTGSTAGAGTWAGKDAGFPTPGRITAPPSDWPQDVAAHPGSTPLPTPSKGVPVGEYVSWAHEERDKELETLRRAPATPEEAEKAAEAVGYKPGRDPVDEFIHGIASQMTPELRKQFEKEVDEITTPKDGKLWNMGERGAAQWQFLEGEEKKRKEARARKKEFAEQTYKQHATDQAAKQAYLLEHESPYSGGSTGPGKNLKEKKEILHKMTEMSPLAQGAWGSPKIDDSDRASYMKDKVDKFLVPKTESLDLSKLPDPKTQTQNAARAAALANNPFGASPPAGIGPGKGPGGMASFMEYVENEQDYYSRGKGGDQNNALMLNRFQAREVARKRAGEARTEEVFGPEAGQQLRTNMDSQNYIEALLSILEFDMRSFTLSNGVRIVGPFILFRNTYYLWDVTTVEDVSMEKMMPLAHIYPVPSFVLFGMGVQAELLHPDIHMYMRTRGTRLDEMNTLGAMGFYNTTIMDGYDVNAIFMPYEPINGFDFQVYQEVWRQKRKVAHGEEPAAWVRAGGGLDQAQEQGVTSPSNADGGWLMDATTGKKQGSVGASNTSRGAWTTGGPD